MKGHDCAATEDKRNSNAGESPKSDLAKPLVASTNLYFKAQRCYNEHDHLNNDDYYFHARNDADAIFCEVNRRIARKKKYERVRYPCDTKTKDGDEKKPLVQSFNLAFFCEV